MAGSADDATPPATAAAYTAEDIQRYVSETVKPLKEQIEALLRAAKEANDREKAQDARIKRMEGEKAKQEETIGVMKKKLKIKAEDDHLTTDEEDEEEGSQTSKTIKDIKGFDIKTAPKPDKYGGDVKDFHVWQDIFTATMRALDSQWMMILKETEDMDEEIIKKEQEEEMKERWGVPSEAVWTRISCI